MLKIEFGGDASQQADRPLFRLSNLSSLDDLHCQEGL